MSCISLVTKIVVWSLYFIPHYIHICFDWNVLKYCLENMMNRKRESHGFLTSLAQATNAFVTSDCLCKPCWTREDWRCTAGPGRSDISPLSWCHISRAQMSYLRSRGCHLKSLLFRKNVFGDAANTVDLIQCWWLRTHLPGGLSMRDVLWHHYQSHRLTQLSWEMLAFSLLWIIVFL